MRLGVLTDGRVVAVDGADAVDVTAALAGDSATERLCSYLDRADEVRALAAGGTPFPSAGLTFAANRAGRPGELRAAQG